MATSVNLKDKVTCTAQWDAKCGVHLANCIRTNTYIIGNNKPEQKMAALYTLDMKTPMAWVYYDTLTVVENADGSSPATPETKTDIVAPKETDVQEDAMSSDEIESTMVNLIRNGITENTLKYNMRLFGLPHQFTPYCDYRTYSYMMKDTADLELIGRKFIDNIMLEAPVVTIVPGKPVYLGSAKNKAGVTSALLNSTNSSISNLITNTGALNDESMYEHLRYYDFQQDYYSYMRYVNVLCTCAAAFLDLNIDDPYEGGKAFTTYDWKNYRWNQQSYKLAVGNMFDASKKSISGFVDKLKTYGTNLINSLNGDDATTNEDNTQNVNAFDGGEEDKDLLDTLEELMTQMNFVQFYIDGSSSQSESASNTVTSSKLEGMMESGSDLFKEVAFLANSGGIDAATMQEYADKGLDVLGQKLSDNTGTMSTIMSRLLSTGSTIIKGDNLIFPRIYQSSDYSKQYTINIDLRAPYGNKASFYLNILVPLFHLLALAIPKQTTANTYGSPFLIKAYYPGVWSCNLGIVTQIQIDKNTSGDSWSVDGFPNEVKVSVSIDDLYSDLTMTPAKDFMLFISNSSLIEFLATNCGINLVTPQLKNRVNYMATVIKQNFTTIDDDVTMSIFDTLENTITKLVGI